jgi:hypothetical protein
LPLLLNFGHWFLPHCLNFFVLRADSSSFRAILNSFPQRQGKTHRPLEAPATHSQFSERTMLLETWRETWKMQRNASLMSSQDISRSNNCCWLSRREGDMSRSFGFLVSRACGIITVTLCPDYILQLLLLWVCLWLLWVASLTLLQTFFHAIRTVVVFLFKNIREHRFVFVGKDKKVLFSFYIICV